MPPPKFQVGSPFSMLQCGVLPLAAVGLAFLAGPLSSGPESESSEVLGRLSFFLSLGMFWPSKFAVVQTQKVLPRGRLDRICENKERENSASRSCLSLSGKLPGEFLREFFKFLE